MQEILFAINQVAQALLMLAGVAAAIIAAVQGSKWGQAQAVKRAQAVLWAVGDAAHTAVRAVEQAWRDMPAPDASTHAGVVDASYHHASKRNAAVSEALTQLAGIPVSESAVATAIEAAVREMNEERNKPDAE